MEGKAPKKNVASSTKDDDRNDVAATAAAFLPSYISWSVDHCRRCVVIHWSQISAKRTRNRSCLVLSQCPSAHWLLRVSFGEWNRKIHDTLVLPLSCASQATLESQGLPSLLWLRNERVDGDAAPLQKRISSLEAPTGVNTAAALLPGTNTAFAWTCMSPKMLNVVRTEFKVNFRAAPTTTPTVSPPPVVHPTPVIPPVVPPSPVNPPVIPPNPVTSPVVPPAPVRPPLSRQLK